MNFTKVILRSVDMFLEEKVIHELVINKTYNSNGTDSFDKSYLLLNIGHKG